VKRLDEAGGDETSAFFDEAQLEELRRRQVRTAVHVDHVLAQLYDIVPPRTWIIVTSDHGELFGEEGWFGHGPIVHEKVFEVPFVEGTIR
jgi:arylsulfatase A-like enzyme